MSIYDQEKAWSDFRVGLITFISVSFVVLGVTFAGGDKGLLFHKSMMVKARLFDVNGLKKGSSVAMGGMTIGKVSDITFVPGSQRNEIEVAMILRTDVRERIKKNSVPSVRTQGMMGDRYVDISAGSLEAQPLADGGILIGKETPDFDTTLRQASEVLTETQRVLNAVNEQRGSVGQFFYDEKFYNNLTEITTRLNDLIEDFKKHPRKYIKFSLF